MEIKHWEIDKLEELINKKLPNEKRQETALGTLGKIICMISKSLIKSYGYSIASTIMKRELRELGREDAKKLMEFLGVKEMNEENIKNVLNAAAIILGLKLGVWERQEVVVKDCPFFQAVKEARDPFICNICTEYNRGILESLAGDKFALNPAKKLSYGDEYCVYKVLKV